MSGDGSSEDMSMRAGAGGHRRRVTGDVGVWCTGGELSNTVCRFNRPSIGQMSGNDFLSEIVTNAMPARLVV